MLNPTQELALMEERKRKLLREARMHQLFQQAEQDGARAGERLLALVGDLMISGGRKLKQRSGSPLTAETMNL